MEEVENSSLSVSRYLKEKDAPFGYVQYYTYKKALRERGVEGLYDQRSKGNHLKFTKEIRDFVKVLLKGDILSFKGIHCAIHACPLFTASGHRERQSQKYR